MSIWGLADLHLSFGAPKKNMEVFGPTWKDYSKKIENSWKACIQEEDLVLLPGDISWAMTLEGALIDLEWIDKLPGQKVMIKGNHDYWWPSSKKLREVLPPTIKFVHNNAYNWRDITIGGARLWDTYEYAFDEFIVFQENPYAKKKTQEQLAKEKEQAERIFQKDLHRLTLSLAQLDPNAKYRLAMTHYPPISANLKPSRASAILEDFKIDVCIFGHLHNVKPKSLELGTARGVRYVFASADYLNFTPIKIFE